MIPFNKAHTTGNEEIYIHKAIQAGNIAASGYYTKHCEQWLEEKLQVKKALLTNSCTAALEIAALLIDIKAGDEVIMPSFTYPSTANAFILRGAKPVFIDIHPLTLTINEKLLEAAITKKTRAIVVVHYAGVSSDMDFISALCKRNKIYLIEDAAQSLLAFYKNKPLGSFGDIATLSFHSTKNIQCGEGGALLLQDSNLIEKAIQILNRGTNKAQYLKGKVDKYEWTGLGVSGLLNELSAAYLWAQLEKASAITQKRAEIWQNYKEQLHPLVCQDQAHIMQPPNDAQHNGHIFWLIIKQASQRDYFVKMMQKRNIEVTTHYQPLHTAPTARIYTNSIKKLPETERASEGLIRLPLYPSLTLDEQSHIIKKTIKILGEIHDKI